MESLLYQARAFFITIAIGALAGFCYDYYRVIRRIYRLKTVGTYVGDTLFWLVTTVVVFISLLWGNWGEMRLYVLIGLGTGALLYFRLFSRPASRVIRLKFFILHKVCKLFRKTLLFLWTAILLPFRLVILIFSYPLCLVKLMLKKAEGKLRIVFHSLIVGKLGRLITGMKSNLKRPAFWKRKKE